MRFLLILIPLLSLKAQTDGVKYDTPDIRVLTVTDAPHHKSALHQHKSNRVMIYLDAGQMDLVDPAGAVRHISWKAGEMRWDPAGGMHTSENVGLEPFRIVELELKHAGREGEAGMPQNPLDPVKVDPDHYKVELDNNQVRVLRVHYGPHEKGVLHEHALPRVVVYVHGQQMRVTTPGGHADTAQAAAGDVKMAAGTRHTEENVSDNPFDAVVVEIKP